MDNKVYEKPSIEIVRMQVEDIITTSGEDSGVDLPFHPWDD